MNNATLFSWDMSTRPAGLPCEPARRINGWVIADSPTGLTDHMNPTPAATPSGSNTCVVYQMPNAATLSGSNAQTIAAWWGLTPKGSQLLAENGPNSATTPKGSQPEFRVSDRSGTPQAANQFLRIRGNWFAAEEYSGERDPEASRGDTPNTSTSSV
jgi:hypothetical protein